MMSPEWSVSEASALDWRRHMRNIVDEVGEIIAKATDDHTVIGGHLQRCFFYLLRRRILKPSLSNIAGLSISRRLRRRMPGRSG